MAEKNITIEYYAILREERGQDKEFFTTSATTASELYAELCAIYSFSMPSEALKIAVNSRFQDWSVKINAGDTVVFIPPVAGG